MVSRTTWSIRVKAVYLTSLAALGGCVCLICFPANTEGPLHQQVLKSASSGIDGRLTAGVAGALEEPPAAEGVPADKSELAPESTTSLTSEIHLTSIQTPEDQTVTESKPKLIAAQRASAADWQAPEELVTRGTDLRSPAEPSTSRRAPRDTQLTQAGWSDSQPSSLAYLADYIWTSKSEPMPTGPANRIGENAAPQPEPPVLAREDRPQPARAKAQLVKRSPLERQSRYLAHAPRSFQPPQSTQPLRRVVRETPQRRVVRETPQRRVSHVEVPRRSDSRRQPWPVIAPHRYKTTVFEAMSKSFQK